MTSKRFENIADNEKSVIRDMLEDAVDDAGGYNSDIFNFKEISDTLSSLHSKVGSHVLDLKKAQQACVQVDKIKELVVNENSAVRELNLAVLMTHWDYIASVYFFRGNALMASKRWFNAIEDFKMALFHGFSEQVFRVHHKIGTCHVKRKQYQAATASFKVALQTLNSAKGESEKTKKDFSAIMTECIKKFSSKSDEPLPTPAEIVPTRPSSVDPRLSDMVEVLEEMGKGRTALARSSIPVGSVLAVDEGLGPHLNPDHPQKTLQYCLQCLRNVSVPYPCPTCPRVVFCGQSCQLKSSAYHQYQCSLGLYGLRSKDTKDGCSVFSTLVVVLSRPVTWWVEHNMRLLIPSPNTEWPTPDNTDQQKMENLFAMVTNEELVTLETRARHMVVVVMLLRALRDTDYYKHSNISVPASGGLTKEEIILGRILFRLRLINDMNGHPIWGAEYSTKDRSQIGTEIVGGGLYTAIASFFNSSCNPNTLRVNIGRKLILVASRNIRKGEEVTDNYCSHFSDMATDQRRQWMQENFLFNCECEACEDDWPSYSRLPATRPTERVSDKLVELEMDNMTAMECGNHDKAIQSHCKEISLIGSNLSAPHQLMVTVRSSFTACWWRKVASIININNSGPAAKEPPIEHYICN